MKTKAELQKEIILKDKRIEQLEEMVDKLRRAIFGPKSEKRKASEPPTPLPLFDIPENPPIDEDEDESQNKDDDDDKEYTVKKHYRKKPGRKPIPDHLPRVEIIHDIDSKDKQCACGCELSRIGEEVSEKLDIVPETIRVIRHVRYKYGCRSCEGAKDDNKAVRIASPPPQIIPKGLPTASLLARAIAAKFCDHLPFYRQVKQFRRIGVEITRQSMGNWAMTLAQKCQPLMDLLHDEVRGGPCVHADETTTQVLGESGKKNTTKSYMWVYRGGASGKPVVIFQYARSRSADVAKLFMNDYQGVVQTDGYAGYDFLDTRIGVLHVGCWAHARRKFIEAESSGTKKQGRRASKALGFIRKLYRLEKQAKEEGLNANGLYAMRQQYAKPILAKMKKWLLERAGKVTPQSLFGKAVSYCLNQWRRLSNYTQDGNAAIDNNVAENCIRPFVIGRKNWLFSGSPAGAKASASLYSLIETAKANNLEPYSYLRFIFERIPTTSEDQYQSLLPTRLKQTDLTLPTTPTGI